MQHSPNNIKKKLILEKQGSNIFPWKYKIFLFIKFNTKRVDNVTFFLSSNQLPPSNIYSLITFIKCLLYHPCQSLGIPIMDW